MAPLQDLLFGAGASLSQRPWRGRTAQPRSIQRALHRQQEGDADVAACCCERLTCAQL
jgi:hypothetical protein